MKANTGYGLRFDHQYSTLGERADSNPFFVEMPPEGVAEHPKLLAANPHVAHLIGLSPSSFSDPSFAAVFSGNQPLIGGKPLAMAYSGHQFGHWAGQLGDGRAILLGQVRDAHQGLWDIQLKGSGLTPFSRMGDGRAVLRSSVREYLGSIAMHGLSIPTSHALCLVASGSNVRRERIETGAVLTRIAQSHIRFGHFEHFTHHKMPDQTKKLFQHMLNIYLPEISTAAEYFDLIVKRTAHLIADWQAYGFAHGVMNSDNMSALGLTIDYGPFGFLEGFDLGFICNRSDDQGRYRFDRQPEIGQWNLLALAHGLTPVLDYDQATEIIQDYLPSLMQRYHQQMLRRLGLSAHADKLLWQNLLVLLQETRADYSTTFWDIHAWLDGETKTGDIKTGGIFASPKCTDWLAAYRSEVDQQGGIETVKDLIEQANPRYILRNWYAEQAIRALNDNSDTTALEELSHVLAKPFESHVGMEQWQALPPPEADGLSVSCSS